MLPWIKFANSLKLRILIRQSRITGRDSYITTEINKAAATPEGFLTTGLDVTANPGLYGFYREAAESLLRKPGV